MTAVHGKSLKTANMVAKQKLTHQKGPSKQCRQKKRGDNLKLVKSKAGEKPQRNKNAKGDHNNNTDDPPCFVCGGLFSDSKRGERKWIQCNKCQQWAHEVCVDIGRRNDGKFLCDFCK